MKTKSFEIQESIKMSQKEIDEVIERYKGMNGGFHLCFGNFSGNKDDIIREIENRTDVGKELLLMNYRFKKYFKKEVLENADD